MLETDLAETSATGVAEQRMILFNPLPAAAGLPGPAGGAIIGAG